MKNLFLIPAALFTLAACSSSQHTLDAQTLALAQAACEGPSGANCVFSNSPVKLDKKRPIRFSSRDDVFYPLKEDLRFTDGRGQTWLANTGSVTDGASIPNIFIPIIGSPTSKEFVNAAAVHDAYCGIGNEDNPLYQTKPWREVHIMFYEALRAGGTPPLKAKVMFVAVYMGGPRWGSAHINPNRIPEDMRIAEMADVKTYIETENPSLDELISDLERREGGMAGAAAAAAADAAGAGSGGGEGNGGDNGGPTDNF